MDWWIFYERLSSETMAMRELDDVQYAQLKALIPRRAPYLTLVQMKNCVVTKELAAYRWCKSLLEFNEIRRTQRKEATATAPPSEPKVLLAEQQDELNFIDAVDVLAIFPEKFSAQSALTSYLKLHPQIRIHKKSTQRKSIHAGDLLRQMASDAHAGFDQLDNEELAARTQREKQKSLRKQK